MEIGTYICALLWILLEQWASVTLVTGEKVTSLTCERIYMMKGFLSANGKKTDVVIIYKVELHTYRVMCAYIFHLWYSSRRPSSKLLEDDWHCKCLFPRPPPSIPISVFEVLPFLFPTLLPHPAPFVASLHSTFFNSNSRQVLCGE